jgi:DNA polymerase-3 subunit gamma/tau
VWNGSANIDVVEIDAASNRGVEDARDLRERAMYAASQEGHHKVYIVDEAHMLTREAWNALLKILEEPPPGVVFVFATTEPQKIAAAAAPVMSRLQRFDFRRIGPSAIRERLRHVLTAEGIAADDDALTLIARHADGGMRDALSVLDQCLSFGEGAVTAERVREVLGLVGDDLYSEVLRIVVERRPAGVFDLVERLVDAGVDLAEFLAGTGEALRSLLMVQVGAPVEGVTDTLRGTLEAYRNRLEPGDVVRMLRLLADNEMGIRRSVNPRLSVETLLLRWTLLDRIVDLEQVLQAGGRQGGEAGKQGGSGTVAPSTGSGQPVAPVKERGRQAAPAQKADPPEADPLVGLLASPPTIEAIRAAWPAMVAAVRVQSRFLGEALAATQPVSLEPPWLTVVMGEPNPLFADSLQEQAGKVEEVLSRSLGQQVRLRVTVAEPAVATPGGRPRRMSESSLKAERLREFRSKDPALDTAADALDLEIVD